MVDLHSWQMLGAVWFKHKYLTHPSVTPVDRITAAIGGLAKTLTTGIPLQLRNGTLDKLKKLQHTLLPTAADNTQVKLWDECKGIQLWDGDDTVPSPMVLNYLPTSPPWYTVPPLKCAPRTNGRHQ